jgi:predicted methyltransferase
LAVSAVCAVGLPSLALADDALKAAIADDDRSPNENGPRPTPPPPIVLAGTADVVLTARNIHNWMWQAGMLDKDKKDYPDGVWMLPPNFRAPHPVPARYSREDYEAIGESDRMTLRFEKV